MTWMKSYCRNRAICLGPEVVREQWKRTKLLSSHPHSLGESQVLWVSKSHGSFSFSIICHFELFYSDKWRGHLLGNIITKLMEKFRNKKLSASKLLAKVNCVIGVSQDDYLNAELDR